MPTPTTIMNHTAELHQDQEWAQRHLQAWQSPRSSEVPIKQLILGWAQYAELHQERFQSPIGDDGVLGEEWAQIGRALRGLLNGETGRFDCGTLDGAILNIASSAGVDLDE